MAHPQTPPIMNGRTILVTGAGSGIGLATALLLPRLGFRVVGLVPNVEEQAELTSTAHAHGSRVESIVADLTDPQARATASTGWNSLAWSTTLVS